MITKNTPSDTAISPKKGILVVSFGTSHPDTRAVTINASKKASGMPIRILRYTVPGPAR